MGSVVELHNELDWRVRPTNTFQSLLEFNLRADGDDIIVTICICDAKISIWSHCTDQLGADILLHVNKTLCLQNKQKVRMPEVNLMK